MCSGVHFLQEGHIHDMSSHGHLSKFFLFQHALQPHQPLMCTRTALMIFVLFVTRFLRLGFTENNLLVKPWIPNGGFNLMSSGYNYDLYQLDPITKMYRTL